MLRTRPRDISQSQERQIREMGLNSKVLIRDNNSGENRGSRLQMLGMILDSTVLLGH